MRLFCTVWMQAEGQEAPAEALHGAALADCRKRGEQQRFSSQPTFSHCILSRQLLPSDSVSSLSAHAHPASTRSLS